jgi:hypothetical protein
MRTRAVLPFLLLSAACGGSTHPSPVPPTDGGAKTQKEGGVQGSDDGGTGVTSGTFDASAACYPPCLASLLASCAPGGTCVISPENDTCYTNGVKVVISLTGTNEATTVVTKNGQLCYTEKYVGKGGTATTSVTSDVITYIDPTGNLIATENDDETVTPPRSTVTCGTTKYEISTASQACSGPDAGQELCSMGACE